MGGVPIPSVSENPVTSQGKIFNCMLRDTAGVQSTSVELKAWLTAVDKSGVSGKLKPEIYQHGVLSRLLWPLLIYEVPVTIMEDFEYNITNFLFRCLALINSLNSQH